MIKYMVIFLAIALAPMAFGSATFDFTFIDSSTGASATGQFSIDPSLIFNGNNSVSELTNLSITVSGATAGNGTFGESDFSTFAWESTDPDPSSDFNFAQNLVGQNGFGSGFGGGDFNFFNSPSSPLAPGGVAPYTLGADGRNADAMALTSLQEVTVPEPAAMGLTALGLLAMSAVLRRRALRSR